MFLRDHPPWLRSVMLEDVAEPRRGGVSRSEGLGGNKDDGTWATDSECVDGASVMVVM